MTHPLYIVDVFAEARLTGNPLGVVLNAQTLSAERMQAVARELGFSETTFVTGRGSEGWRVRIFTPEEELPFAGHPTLGTAWVLHDGLDVVTLELAVGPITVSFDSSGIGWVVPPEPTLSEPLDVRELAAEALSLRPHQLGELPVVAADIGPRFVLVPVADAAALQAAVPEPAAWGRLAAAGAPGFLFAFSDDADGADWAARMFFRAGGVREDPATGSANVCLARYLQTHAGASGVLRVAQGEAMLRPSRLYLDLGDALRVGGRVFQVVTGELHVDP